jgi:cysteinyl-tRNA synthetase
MIRSNIPDYDKLDTLLDWDRVLGLDLKNVTQVKVPDEVRELGINRELLRKSGKFVEADHLRQRIEKLGFAIVDDLGGTRYRKI